MTYYWGRYTVSPALDLTKHQGIGMFVEGDGSGGTLVVSVICGTTGRDYAVPLTFTGKQWVEIPSAEQGLRAKTWGPIGHGLGIWAGINYGHVIGVAIGVGYLPPHGRSNVTVSGLQALAEISEPLVDPKITVGDKTVQANGTLRTYDHFTLAPDGTFMIYDPSWKLLSNGSVGEVFNPLNLDNFEMTPSAPAGTEQLWLEVNVAGSTETVPNPAG